MDSWISNSDDGDNDNRGDSTATNKEDFLKFNSAFQKKKTLKNSNQTKHKEYYVDELNERIII